MLHTEKLCILENDKKDIVTPQVAIIVATHNRPKSLEGALINIQSQSFTNIAIVVVDNGELLETQRIVSTYMKIDPRIRYLRNNLRKGAGATRNYGLFSLNRKIEKVFFLDDDDRFSDTDSLENLLQAHESDSKRLMTYGIQRDINTDGSLYQIWPCYKETLLDLIIDTNKVQFPAHTVLWNSAYVRSLGGYSLEFENDLEDIALIVKAFAELKYNCGTIGYVDHPVVNWRRGDLDDDTLHSQTRKNITNRTFIRRKMKQIILSYSDIK